ncbi:lysoplasmalogenase [Nannocystaceae bacterium ST9]
MTGLLLAYSLALIVNLLGHARHERALTVVGKLGGSTIFLIIALRGGVLAHEWGRWMFVGLCCGWIGDACLLGKHRRSFVAGLAAFLLGHLAYATAFVVHGIELAFAALALALLVIPGVLVTRWLVPHVPERLRVPVRIYLATISMMVALACAAWQAGAPASVFVGALAFYASDLSVARERFVTKQLANRLWGLPAYYLGQLLLAIGARA